jgi:hypothetical protein
MGERCASCELDVAAHRVERDGKVYCTSYCRDHAPPMRAPVERIEKAAEIADVCKDHFDPRAELDAIVARLGSDEVRVLVAIARRLAVGRVQYGPLEISTDPRDWRAEGAQEACDLSVYLACELLRKTSTDE